MKINIYFHDKKNSFHENNSTIRLSWGAIVFLITLMSHNI